MNKKAVSPVVATVLLVVITIIMAVVLYVMVGGIGISETQQMAGIVVLETGDGKSWKLQFVSVPPELSIDGVYLVLIGLDGDNTLDATPLTDLKCPPGLCGWKIRYNAMSEDGFVHVGDTIIIDKDRHPIGAGFHMFTDKGFLTGGTF